MYIDRGLVKRLAGIISRTDLSHHIWAWPLLLFAVLLPPAAWAQDPPPQVPPDPLSIEEAIAMAVGNNPGLAEMRARYEALSEIPSQLGTLPDPVLSFNAMNLPTDTFATDQEPMTQMQIGISQILPFPGKLSLRKKAGEYEALAAESSVDEMQLQLIESARSVWWRVYYLDRALDVVASNQDLLRQFIQVAQTKYEVGDGLQQDVLLAQLELSKLFDQEIRLQAIRRNHVIQLNVLMDTSPGGELTLPSEVATDLPDLIAEDILYERAEAARPLLQQEEHRISAAESRLALARREYYPDFKLGVTYGNRSGDNPLPVGGDRSDLLSVGLSVNLPIHIRGRQQKAVNQRTRELGMNQEARRDKWSAVRAEISSAGTDYQEARELFTLFETGIIPQARQTVASMLAGYQVSQVDFLNLVGSQVTLLNFEVQYWKALTDAKQALARLAAAVGEDGINE